MLNLEEIRIAAPGVRSLVWESDYLVDWVGGGRAFGLDGSSADSDVRFAYPFDSTAALPDGSLAVIYANEGTKGLVLKEGKAPVVLTLHLT